ncbi:MULTISPECIES: sensor histidine kinase KdpD [Terrabacteria group]|uniref:sensor histidine kinase n=1 Tax=Bacillati TaxID=1783272 RepID=UPI001C6DFC44|nr:MULTISPECIES: HAMP domain-containing sensor histidine kinase [Terrabacteria group]MBW9212533.1 HAMP domain-containing histidine kinase [Trueperella sp. zg.1013]
MKNKLLGSTTIKILAWMILSLASFSFLIGIYGSLLSSVAFRQTHERQSGYFTTYEAKNKIRNETRHFLTKMDSLGFKATSAAKYFGKDKTNLSMTIKKGNETLLQNFPYENNSKTVTGKYYFRKYQTGDKNMPYDFIQSEEGVAEYVVEYKVVQPLMVIDSLFQGYQVYTYLEQYQSQIQFLLYGGLVGMVLAATYLLVAAGHRKNTDEIVLTFLDKIPLEISIFMLFFLPIMFLRDSGISDYIVRTYLANYYYALFVSKDRILSLIICLEICGILLGMFLLTVAVRIKAKVFWKNTLLYKSIRWARKLWNHLKERTSLTWIAFFLVTVFWLLFGTYRNRLFQFVLVLASFVAVLMFVRQSELLSKVMREYAKGNFDYTVSKEGLTPIFSTQLDDLFKVKEGVQKAIADQLKSEHLKTELITNVSHDLKTPLTNILNYAQIVKEDEKEEERKKHIDIMIHHVNRLKRLTEDVLVASKASTGNMPVHINPIHCEELLVQIIGEYSDRFKERELEIIKINPNPDLMVQADGELLFRVFENLFSNQLKYALGKTRIYLDVIEKEDTVLFVMKNVSKEALNISEEELMERFVQGDDSRSHEGSGLGLSIVKSLVQLQKGNFSIEINGDYFQTSIELKKVSIASNKENKFI